MTGTKQSTLLGGLVLLLATAVVGGLWITRSPAAIDTALTLGPGAGTSSGDGVQAGPQVALEGYRSQQQPTSGEPPATTVIWPLEIELFLIEPATYDESAGLAPIGSGAHAALEGSIFDASGTGVQATVTFTAGANQGRVLSCDSSGKYGSSSLYPGISIVKVETPTGQRALREVLLQSRKTQLLTVGFGSPATVYGSVKDARGEAIVGASVTLDGQVVFSDELGEFVVHGVASGSVLAIVEKPGYALYRETVPVPRGRVVPKDRMSFRLEPGAQLEVTVAEHIGAAGPSQLFLLPTGTQRVNTVRGQRTYPWHRVSPVEIHPGGSVLIEGLPAGRVNLMLYHPGALAKPTTTTEKLVAGKQNQVLLHLQPAPQITGFVKRGGKPLEGAQVVLEAANRSAVTMDQLGGRPLQSTMVMPHLPVARQELRADRRGLFLFTSYAGIDRYYLKATSSDGKWRATKVVEAGAKDVVLELEQIDSAPCELAIGLPSRFQALPVRVRVDGEPRELLQLASGDELVIDELDAGTWRMDARWNGEALVRSQTLRLRERTEMQLALPEGAIAGQSIEERKRAGRL